MQKKLSLLYTILISIAMFSFVSNVNANPTYEDFTTYTEVDPNNHITKTANHIDSNLLGNEDAYVYADKGVNHFSDFEHKINIKLITGGTYPSSAVWGVSNSINDCHEWVSGFFVMFQKAKTIIAITLFEKYSGTEYSSQWIGAVGTWYYLTIKKVGTSLTCKIYSDSTRTNLLETLSLTLHVDVSTRYIYPTSSYNDGNTYQIDVDIENLDLQEIVKEWCNVEIWNVHLHTYSWFLSEIWKIKIHNYSWFLSETWKLNLQIYKWFSTETWNVVLETQIWFVAEIWSLINVYVLVVEFGFNYALVGIGLLIGLIFGLVLWEEKRKRK